MTLSVRQFTPQLRADALDPAVAAYTRARAAGLTLGRPLTRAECQDGPRPCPWVSCRYHLAYEVTEVGSLRERWPGAELGDMPATCLLDLADRDGMTLDEVGYALNLTRERARQIETRGTIKLKAAGVDLGGLA